MHLALNSSVPNRPAQSFRFLLFLARLALDLGHTLAIYVHSRIAPPPCLVMKNITGTTLPTGLSPSSFYAVPHTPRLLGRAIWTGFYTLALLLFVSNVLHSGSKRCAQIPSASVYIV